MSQNNQHEKSAKELDELLRQGAEECNQREVKPFLQTARAIERQARASDGKLDSKVALKQRSELISMAEKMKKVNLEVRKSNVAPQLSTFNFKFSTFLTRPWYVWAGGLATVAAVLVVAVVLTHPGSAPRLTGLFANRAEQVSRLLIPEANAADAFTFAAEKRGADGVDTTTSFIVTTKLALSADDLKQHLDITPADSTDVNVVKPKAVTVADLGGGKFKVTPQEALTPGKVYRLQIPAAIEHADGSVTNKDFTWAVQTRNVFRVTSSVPADHVSFVPVNTGIEFTLNQQNWEDPAPYFSITPAAEGRFEAHNRSLTFVPAKPLAYGQLYTVTLKKGLKLKDSETALEQDAVVRFETQSEAQHKAQVAKEQPKPAVTPTDEYNQSVVGKEVLLPVYWNDEQLKQVDVTGYQLSRDQAKTFLEERGKVPDYAVETKRRVSNYAKYANQKTWSLKGNLEKSTYYGYNLRLPNTIGAGDYLVRIETKGAEPTWTFLEVTRVLTYSIADKNTLLVWAMNVETNRPLGDISVAVGSTQVRTGTDGVARLPVPAVLTATDTEAGTGAVLTLGEGALSSVLWLPKGSNYYYGGYGRMSEDEATLAYLYNDRPLYRTNDKLYAYGLIRDRDNGAAPNEVTLQLVKSSYYWDYFSGEQKVYARSSVQPDEKGFYRSELEWSNLASGYYSVLLKRGAQSTALRTFEVRDFVKPAYTLDLTFDKQEVFAGDTVTGEARVTFFDGTPVADMKLDLSASSLGVHQIIATDSDGRATFSFKTKKWDCTENFSGQDWFYCASTQNVYVSVAPSDGEEAQISAADSLTVWRSHVSLESYVNTEGDKTHFDFQARKVDLSHPEYVDSDTVLAEPVRGGKIMGRIIERTWKQIQTGTNYDYQTKLTYPVYKYELETREVGKIDVTTDGAGKASFDFKVPSSTASYQAITSLKDENGVDDYAVNYFAYNSYRRISNDYMAPPDSTGYVDNSIYFQPPMSEQERSGYKVGEKVKLAFYQGKNELRPAETPIFLYVKSQRGLKDAVVSDKPTFEFDFAQELIPNVTIRGVLFRDGGFYPRNYSAGIDTAQRELNITVTPDKTSYAPGGKAVFHVSLKTKDGQAAGGARIALGLVDEALYAAGNEWMTGDPNPLASIYAWVDDGIILENASRNPEGTNDMGFGGAERGGGGGEQVRRNFKDTAAFETLTADAQGQADITVDLPDNITSWRANLVAITPDLYAGQSRLNVKVTKPLFVDAVVPSPVLVADKPVLKLRAFGIAFKGHEPVSFSVDAPSLGLQNEKVEGKAYEPSYINVKTLTPGEHTLVLRVTSSKGTDAMEKKITVLESRFAKDEKVEVELGPGATLPSLGNSRNRSLLPA